MYLALKLIDRVETRVSSCVHRYLVNRYLKGGKFWDHIRGCTFVIKQQ